jgi:Domain of unknown function (DUF4389)
LSASTGMENAAGAYPVRIELDRPERSSRLLALTGALVFLKTLLALPHAIVLWFLLVAQFFVVYVGYFVVLFTGRMPEGMFAFIAGVLQWNTRVAAWIYGLTDVYPPFSLSIGPPKEGATTPPPAAR